MQKPITLQIEDLREAIVSEINNSGLPTVVVSGVIKEVCNMVMKVEAEEYLNDKKMWKEYLQSEAEQEESESGGGDVDG